MIHLSKKSLSTATFFAIVILATGCSRDDNKAPERPAHREFEPTVKIESDSAAGEETTPPKSAAVQGKSEQVLHKGGLAVNDAKAFQGYTLIAPITSTSTYLIDMDGRVVRTWESDCTPALSATLLENGHLLRAGTLSDKELPFEGPGAGGRIQEFTWEGKLIWDYKYFDDKRLPHHDITKLPNGNILLVVWDRRTANEAAAAGRRSEALPTDHFMADSIVEVKPTGKTTGEVVWAWHSWDHIVQDDDKAKANYGDVAAHPERLDINFGEGIIIPKSANNDDLNKLKGIGYLGGSLTPGAVASPIGPDWLHVNSVAYNAELDQIVLSVHLFSEIWIIDHSTTTAEAAGHTGGRGGKGGDLLYRWGNPRAYRHGTNVDRRLFGQHNAHWIAKGLPGEGHMLVFNNGSSRPDGSYSSVDEIVLPHDATGYSRSSSSAFGPDKAVWSFRATKKANFFSILFSGAQRLPNGDTLICSGTDGTLFEVTGEKQVVWKYVNPLQGDASLIHRPGPPIPGGPKKNDGPKSGGPKGHDGPPPPGQILATVLRDVLRLTPEQRKQLDDLQMETDKKFDSILTDAQRKHFKLIKEMHIRFGPPSPGGPGSGPPGGSDSGPPGAVDGTTNCVFNSLRYAPDFPGFTGKELKPGKPLSEFPAK